MWFLGGAPQEEGDEENRTEQGILLSKEGSRLQLYAMGALEHELPHRLVPF